MHTPGNGNNIEIRFKLSSQRWTNQGFYSLHIKGKHEFFFSLKLVIPDCKTKLICKGNFNFNALFAHSVIGNEEIADTPINLLNIFFHYFNVTMFRNKSDNVYELKSIMQMEYINND